MRKMVVMAHFLAVAGSKPQVMEGVQATQGGGDDEIGQQQQARQ